MATLKTTDDKLTVTFSYTALTAKVQPILEACAAYLWKNETDEEGEISNPIADATAQEKLDVIDAHVKSVIINMANTHKSQEAQRVAREDAEDSKLVI